MSTGFNPFNPGKNSDNFEQVDDSLADLGESILDIQSKLLEPVVKLEEEVKRLRAKQINPNRLQSTDAGEALLKTIQRESSAIFEAPGQEPSKDESLLPCCDETGNGTGNGTPTNGAGNDSPIPGNGGPSGGNGKPNDPLPPFECFDSLGNPIPCPDSIPDAGGIVPVRMPNGTVVKIPASNAKNFIKNLQSQAIATNGNGSIKCGPDSPCPEPTQEPKNEPAKPKCRDCGGPTPCLTCTKACPEWTCWFNYSECKTIVLQGYEIPPRGKGQWVVSYRSSDLDLVHRHCQEIESSCGKKTPEPTRTPERRTIFGCSEKELVDFTRSVFDNKATRALFEKTINDLFNCDPKAREAMENGPITVSNLVNYSMETLKCAFAKVAFDIAEFGTGLVPGDTPGVFQPIGWQIILGFLQQWISPAFERFNTPMNYSANHVLPYKLPSSQDAIASFIRDTATKEQAEQWALFNGECLEQWKKVALAGQSIPTPSELVAGNLRGFIGDAEYKALHRKNGFVDPRFAELHLNLAKFIPGPSDLVRFMVRDVEDKNVYDRFRYDVGFNERYSDGAGLIKKAANKQGVDDHTMLQYWRAAKQLPSIQQALDLFHRFKYDDIEAKFKTTEEDVRKVLQANDVPDFFVDRYIEASYKIVTRVDGRRMHRINTLDDSGYQRVLERGGYEAKDAIKLVEFANDAKFRGLFSERPVKQYQEGLIDKKEVTKQLTELKYKATDIAKVLATVDKAFDGKTRIECTKSLKKRFMQGEFSKAESNAELTKLGWGAERANQLSERWDCERRARPKLATVTTIAQLLEFGLSDVDDAIERMVNFGFRANDAKITLDAILAKMEYSYANKLASERDKKAKSLKRAITQTERTTARKKKKDDESGKGSDKQEREETSRDNKLTKAVIKHNNKFDTSFSNEFVIAIAVRDRIVDKYKFSSNAATDITVEAINETVKAGIQNYEPLANEIAASRK